MTYSTHGDKDPDTEAESDDDWTPEPAPLREGETRDDTAHTRINEQFAADARELLDAMDVEVPER